MASAESFGCVESWNEWDTLREAWVGTLDEKSLLKPSNDPGCWRKSQNYKRYQFPLREELSEAACLAEARKQLDNFVEVLKGEGIVVQRPKPFPTEAEIKTPLWSVDRMGGFTCPRDLFFVAGKQLIEAPMSWRSRYFEHLAWRDLLMSYYTADPRMRYSAAPKPKLVDESYETAEPGKLRNTEIFFDAADCRRFGKDVFFQAHYGTTNDLGRDWVRRELRASGLRVYDFEFESFHFSHIDGRLAPVDAGLAFYCGADRPAPASMQVFKDNDWNLIDAGVRTDVRCKGDNCTPGIHLNVLTIAPRVVIVEKNEVKLQQLLREEGCDVIPVEFSACCPFGGVLNCFSLDVYRHGPAARSYFPTLDVAAERQEAAEEAAAESRRRKLGEGFEPRLAKSRRAAA